MCFYQMCMFLSHSIKSIYVPECHSSGKKIIFPFFVFNCSNRIDCSHYVSICFREGEHVFLSDTFMLLSHYIKAISVLQCQSHSSTKRYFSLLCSIVVSVVSVKLLIRKLRESHPFIAPLSPPAPLCQFPSRCITAVIAFLSPLSCSCYIATLASGVAKGPFLGCSVHVG